MAQPRIGLLAVCFSRLDQAIKLSADHCTFGRVAEQPILAPDHEGPDRALGRIVVDRQVIGFGVAQQLAPVAGQVADGFALCILRRHLRLGFSNLLATGPTSVGCFAVGFRGDVHRRLLLNPARYRTDC